MGLLPYRIFMRKEGAREMCLVLVQIRWSPRVVNSSLFNISFTNLCISGARALASNLLFVSGVD